MKEIKEDSQRTIGEINPEIQKLNTDKNYTKVRFKLSAAGDIDISDGPNKINFSFKGLWVADYSNKDFEVYIKVNPKTDKGDPLKLKPNMSLNFDELQNGCVLEYPAQAGKWIDVYFAHKSAINSGSIELTNTSEVVTYEGNDFSQSLNTVTTTVAELITGDSSRTKCTITNKGSSSIFVGSSADCSDANYVNLCTEIKAGDKGTWKNRSGLYARVTSGTNALVHILTETI